MVCLFFNHFESFNYLFSLILQIELLMYMFIWDWNLCFWIVSYKVLTESYLSSMCKIVRFLSVSIKATNWKFEQPKTLSQCLSTLTWAFYTVIILSHDLNQSHTLSRNSAFPDLGMLRQEDHNFKISLGYIVFLSQKARWSITY